jgi:hypothetical protein
MLFCEKAVEILAINLDALVINIIVNIIILSPVLWLAGRALVGKDKAKFTDAVAIIAVGTIVGAVFGALFMGFLASIILLFIWLGLVKHFFDCGWLKALAISILAVILFIVIAVALFMLGLIPLIFLL